MSDVFPSGVDEDEFLRRFNKVRRLQDRVGKLDLNEFFETCELLKRQEEMVEPKKDHPYKEPDYKSLYIVGQGAIKALTDVKWEREGHIRNLEQKNHNLTDEVGSLKAKVMMYMGKGKEVSKPNLSRICTLLAFISLCPWCVGIMLRSAHSKGTYFDRIGDGLMGVGFSMFISLLICFTVFKHFGWIGTSNKD